MRTLYAVAVVGLVSVSTNALSTPFWAVGLFNLSCASWLSAPADHTDTFWILGFWSGLNYSHDAHAMVGQSTDAAGVISEIRKACVEEPSLSVATATASVYGRFRKDGK